MSVQRKMGYWVLCGCLWSSLALSAEKEVSYVVPVVVEHRGVDSAAPVIAVGRFSSRVPVIDGSGEAMRQVERIRLETLQEREFVFHDVALGIVLQALAEACRMNYVAPSGDLFDQSITLRVVVNPYQLIALLADQYGFAMESHRGVWEFYMRDHQQLIPRTYQLMYSDGGSVSIQPPSVSGSIRGHSAREENSRGREGHVFEDRNQRVLEDVRELLGLTVGISWEKGSGVSSVAGFQPLGVARRVDRESIAPGGQVFYVAETSSLLVIATRAHHRLVEEYLRTLDQQQRLVKIQALIVESSRPENLSLGVNWSGVSGVPFGVSQISREFQKSVSRSAGSGSEMAGQDAGGGELTRTSSRTDTALLSAGDFAWAVHFLKSDEQSRVVNDPVAVTLNRRPVRFETVTELPVQTGSSSTTSAVASSSIQQTEYIEIGFFLDVVPQIIPGGIYGWEQEAVQLDVSIVVSNQVGQQMIGDRPYPVTARRTYAYSVIVPSGYTLAIGGLREEGERESVHSVPLLGDLPLLGFLFRSTEVEKINRNLMAYITPVILDRDSPEFSRNP